MKLARVLRLTVVPVLALACSGGNGGGPFDGGLFIDTGTMHSDGTSPYPEGGQSDSGGSGTDSGSHADGNTVHGDSGAVANSTPMVVNAGPAGTDSLDVPFISISVCVPGTHQCQTIDYVSVDTGSTGLRIVSSALSVALPQATASTGKPLAECYTFDDGYVWGSVRMADIRIAGEVAASIPIQLIGDPGFTSVPGDCSSTGSSEDTVANFGSNALIGINQIIADCGSYCSDTMNIGTGAYYSCSGSSCTAVAVPDANQLPNPIAFFDSADKNGAIFEFPTLPAAGAATLSGTLIFGIGTAANNALSASAKVLTVDDNGNFSTIYNGQTLTMSFFDSGTNTLSFNDDSITQCTSQDLSGFYCPSTTLSLSAQNVGLNNVSSTVMFSVENSQTLFDNASYTAFDDLATTGSSGSFDWGFPFFVGRSVYVALAGASTSGGSGPYFAY